MEDIEEIKERLISELTLTKRESHKTGGQSVGLIDYSITITHNDLGFSLRINEYRSQLKNFELAKKLFRNYLDIAIK